MVATMHCPVCGSRFPPEPVARWTRYVLLECVSCGLQLWDPPEAGDAVWYDASDHYLAMTLVDWLGWYHRWALERLPVGARSLLDIGCADGRFVHAAAGRGIDARGIDHSGRMIDLGNERYGGDRLSRATVDDMVSRDERFDVVTLFEVIEHVPDPLGVLHESLRLVGRGGTVVISTPNREGRPRAPEALDRPPHHLTRWTPRTLATLIERADLDLVELGLSPSRIGLASALLGIRFGVIVGILRRRATRIGGPPAAGAQSIRSAILLKEKIANALAAVLDPFVGRYFRGGSLVAIARKRP